MHRAVTEKELSSLKDPNLEVLIGSAGSVDTQSKIIFLENGTCVSYDKLCICTGAVPKVRPRLRDPDFVRSHLDQAGLQHASYSTMADALSPHCRMMPCEGICYLLASSFNS